MKKLILFRTYSPTVTLGQTACFDESGKQLWESKSLELPWKDNKQEESCIPEGIYTCKWTFSNSKQKWTFQIMDVRGRSGVRIHIANYTSQLKGCVAPCTAHSDMNHDGVIDGTSSGNALKLLEDTMQKKDFILEIVS